ncbi:MULTISPECIES: hypothetical protein [Paenibacillus]|nr:MULTISPECIES: hypothetical protein [Paenibacillus]
MMIYRRMLIVLISVVMASAMIGCTKQVAKEEARKYNMQAYEEGTRESQMTGRGLNGRFLEDLQMAFREQNMRLTNENYVEDEVGNMTYQYRINNDSSQLITVHVYQDEASRERGIEELYGGEGDHQNAGMHNLVISDRDAAIVYTSTGDKTDQYTEQVKSIAETILAESPRRSSP